MLEIGSGLGFTEDELEKLKWIVRQYLSLGELRTLSKAQRCSVYFDPNWKLLESLLLVEYFATHLPNSPVTERCSHRDICEDKLIMYRWRERNLARAKFKAKLLKRLKTMGIDDLALWSEALGVALDDQRQSEGCSLVCMRMGPGRKRCFLPGTLFRGYLTFLRLDLIQLFLEATRDEFMHAEKLLEKTQTTLDKALSSKEHHEDLSCNTIRTSLNSRFFALSSTSK